MLIKVADEMNTGLTLLPKLEIATSFREMIVYVNGYTYASETGVGKKRTSRVRSTEQDVSLITRISNAPSPNLESDPSRS